MKRRHVSEKNLSFLFFSNSRAIHLLSNICSKITISRCCFLASFNAHTRIIFSLLSTIISTIGSTYLSRENRREDSRIEFRRAGPR